MSVLTNRKAKRLGWLLALLLLGAFAAVPVMAQEPPEAAPEVEPTYDAIVAHKTETLSADGDDPDMRDNVVWTCVAAFLVFFMQAGFAMVEAGFTRAKNAVNILIKNLMDFSIGSLAFFVVGFGLMFGANASGWIHTSHFMLSGISDGGTEWGYTFLVFQTVFAATAATIVSGAMAERTTFVGSLCYSVVICLLIYPISGSWAWGGLTGGDVGSAGWLWDMGFLDFAGSTVVHSCGGWLALAGAIVLGPRIGKYVRRLTTRSVPSASTASAVPGARWPVACSTPRPACSTAAARASLSGS
jgi:Amt family ammonium transporter